MPSRIDRLGNAALGMHQAVEQALSSLAPPRWCRPTTTSAPGRIFSSARARGPAARMRAFTSA